MRNENEIVEERIYREEYSIRKENDNGVERYFINFFGVVDDVEVEITYDDYKLYNNVFSKPLTNYENQVRRKLDGRKFEDVANELPVKDNVDIVRILEIKSELKKIQDVVDTCTETQSRRFKMYFFDELTFSEIALKENCSIVAVFKSIELVLNRLKKH